MRCARVWLATVAISALIPSSLSAGGLNPPSAPRSTPGPEPRTPISAETTPGDGTAFFIITRPGSYYLTGNVTNALFNDPHDGIVIAASNVTVDLNGFTLDGFEGLTIPSDLQILAPPTTGILASGDVENIAVRNGTVCDWNDRGLDLGFGGGARVHGISAVDNGGDGIRVPRDSLVSDCIARDNGADGFLTSTNCVVENCVATRNEESGFMLGSRSQVRGCAAESNLNNGFETSTSDVRCLIVECVADGNEAAGFVVGQASTVRSCVATTNGTGGIFVWDGTVVEDNSCSFHPGSGSMAGAVGISIRGDDVRVDGNSVWRNDVGIKVSNGSRCVIIRNRASENDTNYDISGSGNAVGPMVGAGNPITSTSPWANFDL